MAKTQPTVTITPTDREALALVARFPGADTAAVAQVLVANPSRFDNDGTERSIHPTHSVVARRMRRLEQAGAIQAWRSPAARITHYGILEGGIDALNMFGEAPVIWRGITNKTGTALMHARDIAHIAAQFVHGEYADPAVTSLIGDEVPLDAFITDTQMHSSLSVFRKQNPGVSLYKHITNTIARATAEQVSSTYFWIMNPELLVLTAPANAHSRTLTHRPDMVVLTESGKRVAVEVERNVKPLPKYVEIMRVFKSTLDGYQIEGTNKAVRPVQHLVWLCADNGIKNAIMRAVNAVDPNLIANGSVIIADLTKADGTPLVYTESVPAPSRRRTRPQKVTDPGAMKPAAFPGITNRVTTNPQP